MSMKILLLGEFSGLHKNLKEGLQKLGHEVVIASYGDGFKKIPSDISFESKLPGILGKIWRILIPLTKLSELRGFDVVQLINPFYFNPKYFPINFFYNQIIRSNSKFFILGAGDDSYFWRYGRKKLKYSPFSDFLKYDLRSNYYYMQSDKSFRLNQKIVKLSNGLIPIMYEYEISYQGNDRLLDTIPIPVNIDKVKFQKNIIGKKIVIFHGLNRYGFKGTRHVEKAFEYLKSKYPDDLEFIIDGKMPLQQYLKVMRQANVVIDQMYSHSLGVNGVYALAMGKVVMGGAELESLKSLGVESSPVINLKPNAESIIKEVEVLLKKKNQIQEMGRESRKFAEAIHGHVKVAKQYIDTWSNH
jgi:hypothetical protein